MTEIKSKQCSWSATYYTIYIYKRPASPIDLYFTNKTRSNWWVNMNHTIQLVCATTSNTLLASARLLMSMSQAGLSEQYPTHSNMSRREGSHWIGFAAFQLRCERQQWAILADEKDTHPFVIDDTSDPKLPDWLKTTRWGELGVLHMVPKH